MIKKYRFVISVLISIILACMLLGCSKNKQDAPASGWYIQCVTKNNEPVAGVKLQICTDEMCQVVKTDDTGEVLFDGKEAKEYELHVMTIPDGFELEADAPEKITEENRVVTIFFKKK